LGITEIEDLPEKAREYVEFLSNSIGVEIGLISTGPERDQTIILQDSVMESWFNKLKNIRENFLHRTCQDRLRYVES
jgi:hypothetical protein